MAVVVTACSFAPPVPTEPPSPHQAEAALAEAVRVARDGDFEALCSLGDGNCERILDAAGRDRVPDTDPIVLSNVTMREAKGVTESPITRLLVVCGRGFDGEPYLTEIAVLWRNGIIHAIEPVYWSGLTLNGPRVEQADPIIPLIC